MPNLPELPYNLPESLEGRIVVLSEMVGINPIHFVDVSQEDAVKALAGLILYHHLNARDQTLVLQHWKTLPGPTEAAIKKPFLTTFVTRDHAVWAYSTEELLEKKDVLSAYNAVAGALGLSLSIKSAADVRDMAREGPRNSISIMGLLFAGVLVKLNEWEESNIDGEMMNRLRQH